MRELINYSNTFSTGLSAMVEALIFFWFCKPLPLRNEGKIRNAALNFIALVSFMALHYQYWQFLVQCPIMIILMILYILSVRDTNLKNAVFLSVVYCLVQEISHLFSDDIVRTWIIGSLTGLGSGVRESYFNMSLHAFFLILFSSMLKKNIYRNDRSKLRMKEILVPFMSAVPFFYMRTIQYTLFTEQQQISYQIFVALIILAMLSLFQILSNEKFLYEHIDRSEVEKMTLLLQQQKERYRIKKESVDAINRNYHDLKHILIALETMDDKQQVQEYIDRLKTEVLPYELVQKTGNEVLDIQLSEKMGICKKHGIRVTPYIDGRCLDFINPLDLSVIFGNAFDNAIEAALKLHDEEKKEIYIKAAKRNESIIMRFENFIEEDIKDVRDLKTSKADKACHGFGIGNIRTAALKYRGIVNVEVKDGKFCLTILFPYENFGQTVA